MVLKKIKKSTNTKGKNFQRAYFLTKQSQILNSLIALLLCIVKVQPNKDAILAK